MTLPEALTCREVDEWFRSDDKRRSVVLKRRDGSAALLNRSMFYQYLLGPLGFGWALYSEKSVTLLPITPGLVVHADTPAVDAALKILAGDVSSSDDLLVIGGEAPATIATSTLLAQLARAQTEQTGRLEALLQNLSDVIVVVDEAGIIRYISSSGAEGGAHRMRSRVGGNCIDDVDPEDRATLRRLLVEACDHPDTTARDELRLCCTTGESLLVSVAVTDQRAHAGIRGIVLTYRDITEHRAFEQELRHLALHDGLTGLANRALLKDRVTHALASARRSGASVALLYIDLDSFKEVNDGWGHASGDAVLQAVSAVLESQTRPADTVARIGGDEFVVLLEQLHTPGDAAGFASRLHQALEEVILDGLHILISCSVGIAAADGLGLDGGTAVTEVEAEELIRRADAAMYLAKSEGRGRTNWWEESVDRQAAANDRLSAELSCAAKRDELRLHYQPIVNVEVATTGFPASLLELEITETALVSNFAVARSSIRTLKALGVTIAIDDFGTGYSSLSYLHELPVDRVKIDKTFTDRVTEESGASLIRGVIDLAHSLHLRVTAEGIETAPQAQALAKFRCDQGQGYFHAYPVPIEDLSLALSARISRGCLTTCRSMLLA